MVCCADVFAAIFGRNTMRDGRCRRSSAPALLVKGSYRADRGTRVFGGEGIRTAGTRKWAARRRAIDVQELLAQAARGRSADVALKRVIRHSGQEVSGQA